MLSIVVAVPMSLSIGDPFPVSLLYTVTLLAFFGDDDDAFLFEMALPPNAHLFKTD